ncbi:MAG TPA: hypothetical protein VNI01_13370 [Elusimicrobiota bacterium]|nr:hypothetical protein [Elusimicrobiota bacterium]
MNIKLLTALLGAGLATAAMAAPSPNDPETGSTVPQPSAQPQQENPTGTGTGSVTSDGPVTNTTNSPMGTSSEMPSGTTPARPDDMRDAPATTRKANDIAARWGVTDKDVMDLRDKGMSWGDVDRTLAISHKSGKPTSEIVSLHQSGMSWNDVAKHYGFSLRDAEKEAMGSKRKGWFHRSENTNTTGEQQNQSGGSYR